jgi:hypothetical protein
MQRVTMGAGRRKREQRVKDQALSKPITRRRFDLYTLGTRLSPVRLLVEEVSWWANEDESLIGFVFRDITDNDYGWQILARDSIGRFRCVRVTPSLKSESYATVGLRDAIAQTVRSENIRELGRQGDEPNAPVDLLRVPTGIDPGKLHPYFRELAERPGRAPARAVIREIGPWLALSDPHFVEEFQLRQFDQRLWELYLWAAFRELGFDVTHLEAPDFLCAAPGIAFAVEATTVAPSMSGPLASHPSPRTNSEMAQFLENYMPIKFGSALLSKMNKKNKEGRRYWERDEAAGKPFILAVADFHKRAEHDQLGSMTFTQSALWPYLYGHRVEWELVDGRLVVHALRNRTHKFGAKEIPSGFFDLPGAENVSAVIFSNAGTIAKFDRMGVVAGFGAAGHRYLRSGFRYNPSPNATEGLPFAVDIQDPAYDEGWSDELQIFHNPNALFPLSHAWLSGLAQFYFKDGEQFSIIPEHHVWSSMTILAQQVS